MASREARAHLAARQAELVKALTVQGDAPPGFDPARLRAAAASLLHKRVRSVDRIWPLLAQALSDQFAEEFTLYARCTPLPRQGGPLADGRAFARWLAARGKLPDAGRWEAAAVDLRYRSCAEGLVPRRGPSLQVVMLREPRRLVLALCLRSLGTWWVTVPADAGIMPIVRRTLRFLRTSWI